MTPPMTQPCQQHTEHSHSGSSEFCIKQEDRGVMATIADQAAAFLRMRQQHNRPSRPMGARTIASQKRPYCPIGARPSCPKGALTIHSQKRAFPPIGARPPPPIGAQTIPSQKRDQPLALTPRFPMDVALSIQLDDDAEVPTLIKGLSETGIVYSFEGGERLARGNTAVYRGAP